MPIGSVPFCAIINHQPIGGWFDMARLRSKYAKDYDLFAYAEDNRPSLVYLAVNKVNGKRYIGMTRQTLARRKSQHLNMARKEADQYSIFHKAIRKYGADAFEFSIVAECPSYKDAAIEEMRLIRELAPEYNLGVGGEAVPNVGYRMTDAAKEKMRKKMVGKPGYWTGKKRPDIAQKQRERLTGRPDLNKHLWSAARTPEARAKMAASLRGKAPTDAMRAAVLKRRKRILCINDGRVFVGSQEAADAIGTRQDFVLAHLRGRHPHVKGFRLKYMDELEDAS